MSVTEFLPQTPEARAATDYAEKGATGHRAPAKGTAERYARNRERRAFVQGIRWERERIRQGMQRAGGTPGAKGVTGLAPWLRRLLTGADV